MAAKMCSGPPNTTTDLLIRISKLEAEMSILRTMVLAMQPPTTKKFNESRDITRDDISEESRQALIDLAGGLQELSDWELSDMYTTSGKIGVFTINEIKLFSRPNNTQSFLFVGGPEPTLCTDSKEETLLEPAFGVGGIFPHLVRNNIPFFNAQVPSLSSLEWVPSVYYGMRMCEGSAIISFYGSPWNNYWPAALLLYFMARGAPNLFFHVNNFTPVYSGQDITAKIRNIRGTRFSAHTQAVRQAEITAIITAAIGTYEECVQDPCGRTFSAIHTTQQSPDIASEIASRKLELPGRLQALGSRIESGNILTTSATPQLSSRTRTAWRAVFAGLKTDVAVYLSYIYELALPHNQDTISHLQSSVSSILDSYNTEPPSAHKTAVLPIVVLLNCMLPDPESRVVFKQ